MYEICWQGTPRKKQHVPFKVMAADPNLSQTDIYETASIDSQPPPKVSTQMHLCVSQ
jgi:hypothetical protein